VRDSERPSTITAIFKYVLPPPGYASWREGVVQPPLPRAARKWFSSGVVASRLP
jgi:hypothetical protein